MQMTSQDVADSLGLSVGRYEYVDRQQDISMNSTAAEMSPAASTAGDGDSSCSGLSEVEKAGTLLPDSGRADNDRMETALNDSNNTLWQASVDNDADKLKPCGGDHAEGNVGAKTDVITSDKNERGESEDQPVTDAESDRLEYTESLIGHSDINGSSVDNSSQNERCLVKTADALATDNSCGDTDRLAVTSEMSEQSMVTSADTVCQSAMDH